MTTAPTPNPQPPTHDWSRMAELISGYQRSQMVFVAAQLGLADLLADGPRSAGELAEASETHPHSLWRLLRTLAGFGIFALREDGRFELTPAGALLREGVPNSLRPMALVAGNDTYATWGQLLYCIRTGKDGFVSAYGMTGAEYRDADPVANKNFNDWMGEGARRRVGAFLQAYNFPEAGTVVDVGGGDGSLLVSILRQHPGLHGVLFDLPRAVASADTSDPEVAGRLTVDGGSFFDRVPEGGDLYVMSLILHNWADEQATEILRNTRKGIKPNGRLLILDQVLPDGQPQPSMSDLNMLVNCGALERTEREWRALLHAGGFDIASVIKSPSCVEAVPV